MSILIMVGRNENESNEYSWFIQEFKSALLEQDPSLDIRIYPDFKNPDDITFALVWKYPHGKLNKFKNLKCISSLGMGVDHIVQDDTIPNHVPIVRIVDPDMALEMSQYATHAVLYFLRRFDHWLQCQERRVWDKRPPFSLENSQVGIMGMGFIGNTLARSLLNLGIKINAYSQSKKNIPGINCFAVDELDTFLSQTNILICLLPLTEKTKYILNKDNFKKLPFGSYLINIARGQHLVEQDLLDALATGQIAGCFLDVFSDEPLPQQHPFWQHPKIKITPHIASVTHAKRVVPQILENYRRALENKELLNRIYVERGY